MSLRIDMPLITVITANYNSPYLLDTINSVLNQNYENIEYILVDDGSEEFDIDGIRRYIEKRKKSNVKNVLVIQNEFNLGTVRTLNKALKGSTGKYIFNLSADDLFASTDVLKRWTETFESSGAMVMTSYCDMYDENMEKLIRRVPQLDKVKKIINAMPDELYDDLASQNYILGCCTARSRECIEKYGLYDERYRIIEDYPMNLFLLRNGQKIEFWDSVSVKYRTGGVSAAINFNSAYECDSDMILRNELLAFAKRPRKAYLLYKFWKFKHIRKKKYEFSKSRCNCGYKQIICCFFYMDIEVYGLLKRIRNEWR